MDVVKTIINAETNTKFIKVYKNGFMEIPDVIYHILSKDGNISSQEVCLILIILELIASQKKMKVLC